MLTYLTGILLFKPKNHDKVILVRMMIMKISASQIYQVPTMCLALFPVFCV